MVLLSQPVRKHAFVSRSKLTICLVKTLMTLRIHIWEEIIEYGVVPSNLQLIFLMGSDYPFLMFMRNHAWLRLFSVHN